MNYIDISIFVLLLCIEVLIKIVDINALGLDNMNLLKIISHSFQHPTYSCCSNSIASLIRPIAAPFIISLDLIELLLTSKKYNGIMVVVDRFYKIA